MEELPCAVTTADTFAVRTGASVALPEPTIDAKVLDAPRGATLDMPAPLNAAAAIAALNIDASAAPDEFMEANTMVDGAAVRICPSAILPSASNPSSDIC